MMVGLGENYYVTKGNRSTEIFLVFIVQKVDKKEKAIGNLTVDNYECVIKDISPGGSNYKALQGAVTWLNIVNMELGRTWKHDCSFGDSNIIADSPKQFDPTNKVQIAQRLWNHCYFSFGCPCGVDNIMEDEDASAEIAGEK